MDIPYTQNIKSGRGTCSSLAFRAFSRSDLEALQSLMPHFRERLCDFTIGALYLWRDEFQTRIAWEDGLLYIRQCFRAAGVTAYCYPQGPEPARHEGVERLLAHSRAQGEPLLRLCNVSAGELDLLRKRHRVLFARAERDWFDYLYDAPAFAAMVGRRYAGQRNHISKFQRAFPDWRDEAFAPDNLAGAAAFLEDVYKRRAMTGMLREERDKLLGMLDDLSSYNMFGGLLRGEGRVLALAVGEHAGDTLFVHAEKADLAAPGAYQMIAREFVRQNMTPEILYTNREEDAGVEGMRVSKLSYHPVRLLEKYTVQIAV
jgi:hypothetical protein